jgi:hypothetical protein
MDSSPNAMSLVLFTEVSIAVRDRRSAEEALGSDWFEIWQFNRLLFSGRARPTAGGRVIYGNDTELTVTRKSFQYVMGASLTPPS